MKVLCDKPNEVFMLVKFTRKDGKNINGGGCMKDVYERLPICYYYGDMRILPRSLFSKRRRRLMIFLPGDTL